MEQGVISYIKAKYQVFAIQKLIDYIDKGKPITNISIIEAMDMRVLSWEIVTTTTVKNRYRRAIFSDVQKKQEIA